MKTDRFFELAITDYGIIILNMTRMETLNFIETETKG